MQTLLQLNTSLYSDQGQSSQLAQAYATQWQATHTHRQVVVRDLAKNPVAHLSAERFQAFTTKADQRTPAQAAVVEESDQLINELKVADVLVIGLPMYNFGIASTLKAWIDHVARAGQTFKYTDNGPVGLLADRKTVLIAARGGQYAGTALDTQTAYVTTFLNFIGIRDIEFIYAEGLAMGNDVREHSLAQAKAAITRQLSTLQSAA